MCTDMAAGELARKVKPALDCIGKGSKPAAMPAQPHPPQCRQPRSTRRRSRRFTGHHGEQNGAVYKITIGRNDLKMMEMGSFINARMGLNPWAAFVGTDANAAIAGDVAMLPAEVPLVPKALRQNGLAVVAIHHHMLDT